jgi:hypothetical protein
MILDAANATSVPPPRSTINTSPGSTTKRVKVSSSLGKGKVLRLMSKTPQALATDAPDAIASLINSTVCWRFGALIIRSRRPSPNRLGWFSEVLQRRCFCGSRQPSARAACRQWYSVASQMPSSLASSAIDVGCGGSIFFKIASFRSFGYFINFSFRSLTVSFRIRLYLRALYTTKI